MTPHTVDPLVCALFLILGFAVAGTAQALWLALPCSRRFSWPLDGGRTFRGRRIFGDNKTVRGFVVMLPCTGAAFVLLSLGADDSVAARLWPLSSLQYGALGVLGAIGCMTGELPNSFIKRQAGIPPGAPATGGRLRILGYVIDRIDSPLGALGLIALAVPVPLATAVYVLLAGPLMHGAFSVLAFRLGGKTRPA